MYTYIVFQFLFQFPTHISICSQTNTNAPIHLNVRHYQTSSQCNNSKIHHHTNAVSLKDWKFCDQKRSCTKTSQSWVSNENQLHVWRNVMSDKILRTAVQVIHFVTFTCTICYRKKDIRSSWRWPEQQIANDDDNCVHHACSNGKPKRWLRHPQDEHHKTQ